jgi:hypothetical protein
MPQTPIFKNRHHATTPNILRSFEIKENIFIPFKSCEDLVEWSFELALDRVTAGLTTAEQ